MSQNKNWQIKTIGELCDQIFAGGDVPKNNFSNIKTEDFIIPIYANGEKSLGLYGYTNISKVNSPALTISGRGTIGFSVVRKMPFFPIVRLLVLIPNSETDVQFLKYSIDNCNIKHTGSSIPQLTVPTVKGIKIPIPNIETQQAIVSKIEELFSDIDKGIEDLKIAQQQLKTYRQSVLKWAFEGKLTNENVKEGELPKMWRKVKLAEIANAIDPQPSHRTPPVVENGVPFISIKDFNSNLDKINFQGARKVSQSVLDEHLNRYVLEIGDFVIGKIGTIGKPVRLVLPQNYCLSANIVLIQPLKVDSAYLFYYFQSPIIEKAFASGAKATSQAAFGIQKVRELEVCLPEFLEQHQIVQEIESRLSVADKMEEDINESLKQAEALRQSILKKAFSGELV